MHENQEVLLAEIKGVGRVYLCRCSAVHLKIGPVTMNLAPSVFVQAAAMMKEAAGRYEQADSIPSSTESHPGQKTAILVN